MKEVYVSLREIANGMEKEDLLKIVAALYKESEYGYSLDDEACEDLECLETLIDDDDDLLTSIENTFANIDREYGEEDEEDCEDEEDYEECEEEAEDEDWYEDDCEDCEDCDDQYVDDETQALIEENRRKNERALGL